MANNYFCYLYVCVSWLLRNYFRKCWIRLSQRSCWFRFMSTATNLFFLCMCWTYWLLQLARYEWDMVGYFLLVCFLNWGHSFLKKKSLQNILIFLESVIDNVLGAVWIYPIGSNFVSTKWQNFGVSKITADEKLRPMRNVGFIHKNKFDPEPTLMEIFLWKLHFYVHSL